MSTILLARQFCADLGIEHDSMHLLTTFEEVETIFISRMINAAIMDIDHDNSVGRILFDANRELLHHWRRIFDGCVYVNGLLVGKELN